MQMAEPLRSSLPRKSKDNHALFPTTKDGDSLEAAVTGARSGRRGTKHQAPANSPTTAYPAPTAADPSPAAAAPSGSDPDPTLAAPNPAADAVGVATATADTDEEEEPELFGDVIAQPLQGNDARGLTVYARTMKQAGINPSLEADEFHPESRPNPVNQSLCAKAAIAREAVELLQTDCKTKDTQILKALGIAGSFADAVLLQKIVNLDFERQLQQWETKEEEEQGTAHTTDTPTTATPTPLTPKTLKRVG
ncbi:unnamed protein product [Closterium sp. NIES-53]